jgi:hypothetical protein
MISNDSIMDRQIMCLVILKLADHVGSVKSLLDASEMILDGALPRNRNRSG